MAQGVLDSKVSQNEMCPTQICPKINLRTKIFGSKKINVYQNQKFPKSYVSQNQMCPKIKCVQMSICVLK